MKTWSEQPVITLTTEFSSVPYLKEVNVVLGARELLQLSVGPPELHHLPLVPLQQLLGLTDSCSLLDSEQLLQLAALFLYGADQLGENPLALLHCCLCGVLRRGWKFFVFFGLQESCIARLWVSTTYLERLWMLTLMYLTTYLSSFSVSFSFCTDFKEASWSFFWENTKDGYHTVPSLRLLTPVFLPRFTFMRESFDFTIKGPHCTGGAFGLSL